MADTTYSPKFNWDLKAISARLDVPIKDIFVMLKNSSPGTGILTITTNSGHCLAYINFRDVPANNCGIMEIAGLGSCYLTFADHKKDWLKFIEAWARSRKRSVLLGNDGAYAQESERPWWFVQKYGEGYNMIETTWNRNYDTVSPHKVGIFYKNIGACYYENIYGLGTAFDDGSAYHPRG